MKKENKNFFSSMKADPDDWTEWGGKEAKIADLKLRGNFPHRHPVKKEHWNNISDVSILGAALYTMGINPDAIDDENHNTNHQDADFDGLILSERDERLAIIKSALRAGVIDITDLKGDISNPDDYSKILKSSFESWLKDKKFSNKSIAIPAYPDLQDAPNKPNANDGTQESTHDPMTTDGLSKLFTLHTDPIKNLDSWRSFAHEVKRNGLISARIKAGKGKAQSLFDPVKVGDWLVKKGLILQDRVNRALKNNLPNRSSHLKDLYD